MKTCTSARLLTVHRKAVTADPSDMRLAVMLLDEGKVMADMDEQNMADLEEAGMEMFEARRRRLHKCMGVGDKEGQFPFCGFEG